MHLQAISRSYLLEHKVEPLSGSFMDGKVEIQGFG